MKTERIIQTTEDGSDTILIPQLNVTYHSRYGAIQESMHVFIQTGLQHFLSLNKTETVYILEIGFGTGLNALLSLNEALKLKQKIFYEGVEPFPISNEEATLLNYAGIINHNLKKEFLQFHSCAFDEAVPVNNLFSFKKVNNELQNFQSLEKFHLIYFDAFDPNAQPELWTVAIFEKLYQMLYKGGMLVTYCSKTIVRKALLAAHFYVEKLKGPAHKREVIRAIKKN